MRGFEVPGYSNGAKTYLVQRRGPSGSKRITVGRHGTISADEAPGSSGGDDAGPTVADLAERYLREHAEVRCEQLAAATSGRAEFP